jgi:hypothetical protein
MDSPFGGTTMKRIRDFLESIVFAGMKPGGQTAPKRQLKWLGPLRGPVERLLSGGPAPSDPLYLTNRTPAQKLKSWSLIAIPCVVLALGIVILSRSLQPPAPKPVKPLTAAEITAKLLPNLDQDIQLPPATDVQVIEIKVEGSRLVGVVKNTTRREIAVTELVIDLTNAAGSQVGAVNGIVEKIPPSGTKDFQIAIQQRDAAFALIRNVTSR